MKKIFIFLLKIAILIILGVWVIMVFIDYFKTRNNEKPVFCIKEYTHQYDDGTTYECVGLGYKMFKYERDSIRATEFGPIFIEERTNTSGLQN